MIVETMMPWLSAIALLISVGSAIHSVLTARAKGNSEKLDKLEQKVADHERRIQEAENELRHLPSKDDMTALSLSLTELKGSVGILAESFKGVSNTVHNIDTWLREKGGK